MHIFLCILSYLRIISSSPIKLCMVCYIYINVFYECINCSNTIVYSGIIFLYTIFRFCFWSIVLPSSPGLNAPRPPPLAALIGAPSPFFQSSGVMCVLILTPPPPPHCQVKANDSIFPKYISKYLEYMYLSTCILLYFDICFSNNNTICIFCILI